MRREREHFDREVGEAYDELDERLAQQAEDPDVTQRLPRPYPLASGRYEPVDQVEGRHRLNN